MGNNIALRCSDVFGNAIQVGMRIAVSHVHSRGSIIRAYEVYGETESGKSLRVICLKTGTLNVEGDIRLTLPKNILRFSAVII